jgi:MerR family transcriptional regulator, copper efflux regulator
VRRVAVENLDRIEEKIAALQAMRDTLKDLVRTCQGDDRPDCPILRDLATAGRE